MRATRYLMWRRTDVQDAQAAVERFLSWISGTQFCWLILPAMESYPSLLDGKPS
jgi:hypothetical protein